MSKKSVKRLSAKEIQTEIERGGKFVHYQYVISFIIGTTKSQSELKLIKQGQSAFLHSFWYNLSTLLFGWWGVPSGPSTTIKALRTNLKGGVDVTNQILAVSAGYLMFEEANNEK
jgi:hypothetical protein